jgi:hypothetical protein
MPFESLPETPLKKRMLLADPWHCDDELRSVGGNICKESLTANAGATVSITNGIDANQASVTKFNFFFIIFPISVCIKQNKF